MTTGRGQSRDAGAAPVFDALLRCGFARRLRLKRFAGCGLQNLDLLKHRLSRTIVRVPREMSMLRHFLSAARTARSRAAVFAVGYRQRRASHPSVGAAQLVFDRLAKVLKKMEAVGDLARLRRAFTRSLSIETTAVAVNNLDMRPLTQPVRCRSSRPWGILDSAEPVL